jgi:low affinity Fe/Cu permease
MEERFAAFSASASRAVGSSWAFGLAVIVVAVWALTGPMLHFSDTWQLIINTATTISTGLIVFLIQNSQNRSVDAIHKKLDELIRVNKEARDELIGQGED